MSNGPGAQQLSNYLGGARNLTPQWRERDMVDLELSRGGRKSAFIPVGQHRDSPHLGYTNDFASSSPGPMNWYSGGSAYPTMSPPSSGNMNTFLQNPYQGQTASPNQGQTGSGQGSAVGAGNYGGPNINISNVNNPQAIANTGTIEESTISNPSSGYAGQESNQPVNKNEPINAPINTPTNTGSQTGGGFHVDPGPTIEPPKPPNGHTGGGIHVDPSPTTESPTTDPGGDTGGNEIDDWLKATYEDIIGRSPDEPGAEYWKNDLASGQTKNQVIDNIKLGAEYQNREQAKELAKELEGKDYSKTGVTGLGQGIINEDSLDAWVGPGGGFTQSSDPTGLTYFEGIGSVSYTHLTLPTKA